MRIKEKPAERQGCSDMETSTRIMTEESEVDGFCDGDDAIDLSILYPQMEMLTTEKINLNSIVWGNYMDDLENQDCNDNISESCFRNERSRPVPLYCLNPDDYTHDSKTRIRIQRAIITKKYHQDMKEQIIKLIAENQSLRAHVESLKKKMMEIIESACVKDAEAILSCLEIMEMELPPVTPLTVPRKIRTDVQARQAEKQFPGGPRKADLSVPGKERPNNSNSTMRDPTKAAKPLSDSASRLESTGKTMQQPVINVSTTSWLQRNLKLQLFNLCYPTVAHLPNIQRHKSPSIIRTVGVPPPQPSHHKFVSIPETMFRDVATTSSSTAKVDELQECPATATPMSRVFSVKPVASTSRPIPIFDKSQMILKRKCLSEEEMWKGLEKCGDDKENVIDLTAPDNDYVPPAKKQKQTVLGVKNTSSASNTNCKYIVAGTSVVDAGKYSNVDFEAIN